MLKKFPSQKVAIIGAGNVGSAVAYALTIKNVASEINLIDIDVKKQKGEIMDISDGLSFVETGRVAGSRFKDAKNADIIVITAGARQKPKETRLDLVEKNKKIMSSIFKSIGKLKSTTIVIIVSNPVDVLTYYVQKIVNLPASQVIGSGTMLDSARLRKKLSDHFKVSAQNIHGYVLGEHGDSSFAAWSTTTVGGTPVTKTKKFNKTFARKIEDKVRKEAYEIINRKGSTYYGIGLVVSNIVEAIFYNQHLILPISARLTNWNGISNICLGAPAIIGRKGVESHWPLKLSPEEKKKLKKSANIIKKYL